MCFDYAHFGLPLSRTPAGHVSWEGNRSLEITLNPVNGLLMQPSYGPTSSDQIPCNDAANHDLVGHPAVGDAPQEILHCHPLLWPAQFMHHSLGLVFDIGGNPRRQFTGSTRPVRRIFRGIRAGDTVSTTCQWQSQGSSICGQEITGETVPKHLVGHGIQNMRRDCIARCCWRECGALVTRQSIARHLREVHLGMKRRSCARAASATLVTDAL